MGWVTLHPFSKQSLDYTIQYSRTELRKIDTLLSRDFTDGGALFRELHKLKQQGAEDRVMREKMREAQHLKIPMRYLEKFALAGRR